MTNEIEALRAEVERLRRVAEADVDTLKRCAADRDAALARVRELEGALRDAWDDGQHGEDCAVWWVDVDGHRRPFETKDRRCNCWVARVKPVLNPSPATPKEHGNG